MKKSLSFILVLAMIITCFAGLTVNASAALRLAPVGEVVDIYVADGTMQGENANIRSIACDTTTGSGEFTILETYERNNRVYAKVIGTKPGLAWFTWEAYDTESSEWETKRREANFCANIEVGDSYTFVIKNVTLAADNAVSFETDDVKEFAKMNSSDELFSFTYAQVGDNVEVTVTALGYDNRAHYITFKQCIGENAGESVFREMGLAFGLIDTITSATLDTDNTDAAFKNAREIVQKYTLTEEKSTYEDCYKVNLSWTITEASAYYTNEKTWDSENLKWVEAKTDYRVTGGTADFTLENVGTVDVLATAEFTVASGLEDLVESVEYFDENEDAIDFSEGKILVKSVVKSDLSVDASVDNTATFSAKISLSEDELKELDDTTKPEKLGTYTITISNPQEVMVYFSSSNNLDLTVKINDVTLDTLNGVRFWFNVNPGDVVELLWEDGDRNVASHKTYRGHLLDSSMVGTAPAGEATYSSYKFTVNDSNLSEYVELGAPLV